jgi:hypothetical protein
MKLTFILSYEWYIPFTYSIEKLRSAKSEASNFNISNMHENIIWLKPGENKSKSKTYLLFKLFWF